MTQDEGVEKIIGLYAALLISVALIPVPHLVVSVMSGSFFVCLVLLAYMIRMDSDRAGMKGSHAHYIIRTFWVSVVLFAVCMAIAAGGMSLLMLSGSMRTGALSSCSGGEIGPCLPLFISQNSLSFSAASFVALGPSILYLLFRFARGLIRARGGTGPVV